MDDIGLKWVKPDADVDTAGLKDTLIHSKYPLMKFKEIDSGSINYTNDDVSPTDILVTTHGLPYEPQFLFKIQWYDIDAGVKRTTFREAPFIDTLVGGAVFFDARPYIDGDELRLSVSSFDGNGGNFDLDFTYAIYYEPDADL